jgi:hypothetical protein
MTGKLVKVVNCGNYSAGLNTVSFEVSDLDKGLYIVKLSDPGQSANLRLVIK